MVFSITDTPVYSGGDGADGDTDDGTDDGTDNGDGTDDGTDDDLLPPTITADPAQVSGGAATLRVTTDVAATCRYSTSSTATYDTMSDSMAASADDLVHTATTGKLTVGRYTYYVRCRSTVGGVVNTVGTPISFTVNAVAAGRPFDRLNGLFVTEAVAATSTTGSSDSSSETTTATTSIFGAAGEDSEEQWAEEGETENGSGYGRFSARLENLKPGTVYYVRAYALTADGAVYYGPQYRFKTADACFVATASFGTLLHPGVRVLREFRDAFLATSDLGRVLVDRYYILSPPVADLIGQSGALRATVRLLLLPLVGFSWLALQAGLAKALLLAGCLAVAAGRCAVRLRPHC